MYAEDIVKNKLELIFVLFLCLGHPADCNCDVENEDHKSNIR